MAETSLDWLPDNVTDIDIDDNVRELSLTSRSASLAFGNIPDDWTIKLHLPSSPSSTLSATEVGENVVLVLVQPKSRVVTIGEGFTTISLSLNRDTQHRLKTVSLRHLELTRGAIEVAAPHQSITVRVTTDQDRTVALNTDALIESIQGAGPLDVRSVDKQSAASLDDFEGILRIHAPIAELRGRSPLAQVSVLAGSSIQADLEASSFETNGPITLSNLVAERIVIQDDVTDSTLTATRSVSVMGNVTRSRLESKSPVDHVALIQIGKRISMLDPATVHDVWAESSGITWPWTDYQQGFVVANSEIQTTGEAIIICSDMNETAIDTAGDVWIAGTLSNTGEQRSISAKSLVVLGSVHGGSATKLTVQNSFFGNDVSSLKIKCEGRALVDHELSTCQVEAENLTVGGSVQQSTLSVSGPTHLKGAADAETELSATGDVVIEETFSGTLSWSADNGTFDLKAPIRECRIDGSRGDLVCNVGERGSMESLELVGRATVELAAREPDSPPPIIVSLALSDSALLFLQGDAPVVVERAEFAETSQLIAHNRSSGDFSIAIGSDTASVEATGSMNLLAVPGWSLISLKLSGPGHFLLTSEFGAVTCVSGSMSIQETPAPTISTAPTGSAQGLSGDLRLGQSEGRLVGIMPRKKCLGLLETTEGVPKVWSIALQPRTNTGQLVGVDPTGVPYHELEHFDALHVFEPNAKSLILYAKGTNTNPFERQAKAQKLHRLAELVSGRAISGQARSAAHWSAARSQNATVSLKSEKFLRWLHRGLGYSYRPIPPLISYATLVLVWALSHFHLDDPTPPLAPHTFLDSLQRVLLMPTTLFRLPTETTHEQVFFGSLTWHTVAFVTLAIPLAFFLVALRNFLRSPIEKG